MIERLLIAGSGGQGIVLAGKLFATIAMKEVPNVTFFPAYGAEVRGGTSNCQVVLSSEEITSPVCERFDSMIIMNQASADKFIPQITKDGLVITNSSLCRVSAGPSAIAVKATELADDLGDIKTANFILLGAYMARKKIATPSTVVEHIKRLFSNKGESLIDLNIKAFHTGLKQL
ncbi:2-oxoacid:acceptor oxidoreductase family protein [Verrucomicrobiota bacterium]